MPRIPSVTAASMTDVQRQVYDAMRTGRVALPRGSAGRCDAPTGPRREMVRAWPALRCNSSFAPRLREFVVLLTDRF